MLGFLPEVVMFEHLSDGHVGLPTLDWLVMREELLWDGSVFQVLLEVVGVFTDCEETFLSKRIHPFSFVTIHLLLVTFHWVGNEM